MSTVLETPARTVEPTRPPRPWAAVFALARFEARELRMTVSFLAFAVLYVAWIVWQTTQRQGDYPVLQDVDRDTQGMPVLVGLAVMLGVNRAVLRSHRRDTDRHFGVLVVEPWRRTVAHVLSVVPAVLFTAVCAGVQFTWAALKSGAVGHGSPAELAVGPLTVLLFGVFGVLVARLVRSVFAAPLLLVLLLFALLFVASPSGTAWASWLGPVVTESGSTPLPSDLLERPAAWHALYLGGLCLFVAAVAVLVSGGRTTVVKAVVAGSLALTLVGVAGQSGGTPPGSTPARDRATLTPDKVQSCLTHDRSTYCAYPEWTGRTADWAAVVDRVQNLAGGRAGGERLTVQQRIDARHGLGSQAVLSPFGEPGRVSVGTTWGGNRVPEFATAVASVLVLGNEKAALEPICDARVVTIMWLALGADPDPMAALRDVRVDDSVSGSAIVLSPTEPFSMSAEQTRIVRELLQKPRYSVIPKVKAGWTELTSAGTTTAEAARLLGVPAASGAETGTGGGPCKE
ncbi:ABC transporter permease [Streptomyces sp. Qhu-G9]|uniref:ABC transporter permease n=1 Tax=Streptomyces sp. Qhu-G9 TaxID=3452799 RepID=UPI0022AC893B|nr:ABC transporter permease [Streptomyces aurantiacus]WAU85849.1 ABC transporter permease [Streptomyces aurantiacus]